MKIAYITAGAAGMYCGSCLHDNTLASAMKRAGHEVALIPTYTPIRTDETDVSIGRVFYGAINVYLENKFSLFRHTPRVVDRWLRSPKLIDWLARRSVSTNAHDLGEMTLSVLRGEEGNQKKELWELVRWLGEEWKPQIVQLTNSMFLGLAGPIRRELGVPVLCAVQGEDLFVEDLEEPHHTQVRELLRRRARDADGFIATSRYYVDFMREFLDVPKEKLHLVPLGLQLDGYSEPPPRPADRPFTVGYLARLAPEKGLHLLSDGFRELAQRVGKQDLRLRIAGFLSEKDRVYKDAVLEQLEDWDLADVVDFVGEVDREHKLSFLRSLDVLSVPTTYKEPKGLFVLEALASGVPVVQPNHGAFPELIGATGGGLLFEPGSVSALADALEQLMRDPRRREQLGQSGREAVLRDYADTQMAERTLRLYRDTLNG